jgi:murein L,D-transpeptidase YafK
MRLATTPRRLLLIAACTVAAALLGGLLLYRFGRPLWQPVLAHVRGGTTVAQRLREIAARHPDLPGLAFRSVRLIGIKDPGRLDVQLDGRSWRSFAWTARSGGPGPKLRAGDGQIPEGLYRIDAVNPDSDYHLSLRVSYPNDEDRRRSAALGIRDLGGDIYIHGKDASIGCIAIGDDAIDQVFYVVNRVDALAVPVLIVPDASGGGDQRLRQLLEEWTR